MEDYNLEEYGEERERRDYRQSRRKKNELIVYIITAIIGIAIIGGSVFGISKLVKYVQQEQHAKELAKQLESLAQEAEEPVIIEAPQQTEEVVPPTEEKSDLDKIVDACIAELPIGDKIAGLFVVTPEALTGTDTVIRAGDTTKEKLGQYAVGGLVYFSQNIKDKAQLTEMLTNTKNMSKYPIFLAVDEEGGSVARVADSSIDVELVDSMGTIGAGGDLTAAREAGVTIGTYLSELGFNVNFAPVADIRQADAVGGIGDRSFGTDAQMVAEMAVNAALGMQSVGISASMKHFPGLGEVTEDTHDGQVVSQRTLEELKARELVPFQAGIDAGVGLIMVSHLSLPEVIGDDTPASLSSVIITDLLRKEMGYEGIVITDALNMGAITEHYSAGEAAVNTILAGADMILMPQSFEEAYESVLAAVEEGSITEERIDESLRRIYRVKYADKVE